jgi:parvulin-like peptidyl-prolyl isomerase
MEAAAPQDIANAFGDEFAAAIEDAPVGQWSGPLPSGFGVHLVKVDGREAGTAPTLAEIRPLVQREWEAENRKSVEKALLDKLRARYDVRVEGPAAALFEGAGGSGAR